MKLFWKLRLLACLVASLSLGKAVLAENETPQGQGRSCGLVIHVHVEGVNNRQVKDLLEKARQTWEVSSRLGQKTGSPRRGCPFHRLRVSLSVCSQCRCSRSSRTSSGRWRRISSTLLPSPGREGPSVGTSSGCPGNARRFTCLGLARGSRFIFRGHARPVGKQYFWVQQRDTVGLPPAGGRYSRWRRKIETYSLTR